MTGLGMRSNSTCLQLLWIALTAEGRGCYSDTESTTYPVNCSLLFQSSIMKFWYLAFGVIDMNSCSEYNQE